MKLEVVKNRLGVNSRQVRELIKSCGFTEVRNYGEDHVKTMEEYANKIGMKIANPIEEKKEVSKCVICKVNDNYDDGLCEDCWEKYDDGKISRDEVAIAKGFKPQTSEERIAIEAAAPGGELKVSKGELILVLSKAYDVGFEAGKNDLKPITPNDLDSILNEVIITKESSNVSSN